VTAGTGDPVLLIPGGRELDRLAKVLPLLVGAGRRVVVLDPKGFGESDKPLEVTISTLPHATCMVSSKRPTRPPGGTTSSPHESGRGSRTPTPRIIQRRQTTVADRESNIPGVPHFASAEFRAKTANLKSWQFASIG